MLAAAGSSRSCPQISIVFSTTLLFWLLRTMTKTITMALTVSSHHLNANCPMTQSCTLELLSVLWAWFWIYSPSSLCAANSKRCNDSFIVP